MKVQRRRRRRRRRGTMGTIRHLRQIIRILWVKIHSNIMGAQGYLRIMIHVLVCKDAVQHQTILLSFVWRPIQRDAWVWFGFWLLWSLVEIETSLACGPGRQDTPKK